MKKDVFWRNDSTVFAEQWLRELVGGADMPARKIRPSRYSITGYVPSSKGTPAQDAESSLEQDFLTLLEYGHRVARYVAQPFSIHWRDANGKKRHYTPDVIVKYSHHALNEDPSLKTTIFEVKPSKVLAENWLELKPKFRAAIGWAKEFNCNFHIVTEKQIRTPYLQNVRFLMDYRSVKLKEENHLIAARQGLILDTLAELDRTTPRDLLNAMVEDEWLQAELIPWIWNLINCDYIGVDLNKPLTMSSPIWATYWK